ncbi:TetR/AcrR family transcriptional regulator [Acidovorax sp. MR-S7]|uniref:TetR/AcrR family transcriptional regulator n=1 Tax=Acidovorax sp. MR-S7 TaxID=1268622 RepID=UPI00035E1008|nr:TetR/AcrR family transcriptional regulator [Acidovorax sp. MR-S7]GAD20276.1 transcriptional regulator [Acidovorax sp. MR-S7]
MARKAPRRTAERILEASLGLFNRFGEPNVSTTAIAAGLGISPGNLYYHYPAKDGLVNALFARYQEELGALLPASGDVAGVEDAWFFMHTLFELIWQYRFLYRDVNHLVTHNRVLEAQFPAALQAKTEAMRQLLLGMGRSGTLSIGNEDELQTTATSMVVVLTYWLSFEYVRDPRRALEPESAQAALLRGAHHALGLLMPYLEPEQHAHLAHLAGAYRAGV